MSKVLVVGGGAAGMFAAVAAAEAGNEVHIFEKNEKFGKKIYITGKGRCNLTNACEMEDFFQNVCRNPKFLYSAFFGCSNSQVIDFFEHAGCKTKTERGERVFPVSDHASDVIRALVDKMKEKGVIMHLNTEVSSILYKTKENTAFAQKASPCNLYVTGILLKNKEEVRGNQVIVATGGLSYPSTGSTGDGYRFAKDAGHQVTPLLPALVPFNVKEEFVKELQGLSLRNVQVTIFKNQKKLYENFGEMLFTHFGVSGPLLLTASSVVGEVMKAEKDALFSMEIDLKPALDEKTLDNRILRDFEAAGKKQFKNSLGGLFPVKLIAVIVRLSKIPGEKKVNEITKEERLRFLHVIKHFPLTLAGTRGFSEAIVTKGGVLVKEINSSTMESKLCKGLYFAGEVLDLDALTGGFNLQIAWSTGYLAGSMAGKS